MRGLSRKHIEHNKELQMRTYFQLRWMWLPTLICAAGFIGLSLSGCRGQERTSDAASAMGAGGAKAPIEMLIIYGMEVKDHGRKPTNLIEIFDHKGLAYYLEYLQSVSYDIEVTVLLSHGIAEKYQKEFQGFGNVRFQVLELGFRFPKSYDYVSQYCDDEIDDCIAYSHSWVMPSFLGAMNHLAGRRGSIKRELRLNLRNKPGLKAMFRRPDAKKVVVSLTPEHVGLYSNEEKTTQQCLASNVSKLDLYVRHNFSLADIGTFIYGLTGALTLGVSTLSPGYRDKLVSPSAQGTTYFQYGRCDVLFADFKGFMDKEYGAQAKNDFQIFIFNPSQYVYQINNEYKLIAEEYNGQYYQSYGHKIDWWQQVFGKLPELAGLSPQPYLSEDGVAP